MEEFKIENFVREHVGVEFPWYRPLAEGELNELQHALRDKLPMDGSDSDLKNLVFCLQSVVKVVDGVSALDEGFSFVDVLKMNNLTCTENVYLNWYRFDDVDEMKFVDLNCYFDDIWYPGTDDIDICDKSLSWVVSIRHDGIIGIYKSMGAK